MARLLGELEYEIRELEKRRGGIGNNEEKVKRPKIQGVPSYLGGMGFDKYFTPQIISFGPFHWNKPYVKVGNQYKYKWTAMYLADTNQQHSYGALRDRIYLLKDALLASVLSSCGGKAYNSYCNTYYWENGIWVHQDMLLLENQVPFNLLKIICNDNAKFNRCLHNFLNIHGLMITGKHDLVLENDHHLIIVDEAEEDDPIHLLDYLRRALLFKPNRYAIANIPQQLQQQQNANIKPIKRSLHLRKYRIGSVRELKNTGIRVKKHSHDNVFHPIFNSDSATLQLPQLTVDCSTMLIFLNLIAYEMCPDFRNDFEITSYIVFLSSLIETPGDVKELRLCGVLINELASDKEVADLFNRMDTLLVPETSRYANIRDEMQQHFVSNHSKIKMLGWMGEAYSSFLRSPWTVIALLAATLGLTLTFIQTWFAIHPKGS